MLLFSKNKVCSDKTNGGIANCQSCVFKNEIVICEKCKLGFKLIDGMCVSKPDGFEVSNCMDCPKSYNYCERVNLITK